MGLRPAWGEALLPPRGRTVGRVRLRASCGDVCSPSRPWELRMRSRRHPGPRVIPSRASGAAEGALGAAPSGARAWRGAREPGGPQGLTASGAPCRRRREGWGWGWCRRSRQSAERAQRCDLGAPAASGSWTSVPGKGTGAGRQGDGPVGSGGAAVQEEVGEVSVGCPRLEARRQESVPSGRRGLQGRRRIIRLEGGRETWRISPYSRARKSRGTQRGKALSPPVKMCSARNPS